MKPLFLFLVLVVLAAPLSAATTLIAPTFAHDIAPIVYRNCSPCHRPGEAGPFSLLTYDDVKRHAHQIVAVTSRRYMPPWLPEPGYGDFQDERRLTDAQIHLIAAWVNAGAPEGAASDVPPPPHFTVGWQLGPPDLILQAAHPFLMPASGPDLFWNFIFKPNLSTVRYIRAIEIRPGGAQGSRNVHHANLIVDRTGAVLRREAAPSVGFPGMDLTVDRSPFDPASHFLFWKPGTPPYSEPDGFSWALAPGNILVLNTHLQPTGKPEQVAPSVGLYFTDRPPTHFPLLIQLQDDEALDIPASDRDFLISDDFRMPVDTTVLAVYPHAHYLGKLLEAYATLPDGTRRWLIRIPNWDLNWQAVYRYRQPLFLPKGSIVSMRFHYDNSAANPRNPHDPPQRVMAGNQATDEMGHLWLQVLPRTRGDRLLIQEALMRHRLDKYPGDFTARLDLGAILLSRLDPQGAVTMLEAAVRIDPSQPEAHDLLGSALRSLGRSAEAMRQFRLALQVQPDDMEAHYNLGVSLVQAGEFKEAVEQFRALAAAYPASARLQNQFGEVLARAGQFSAAIAQFDKALAIDPSNADARQNRAAALSQLDPH